MFEGSIVQVQVGDPRWRRCARMTGPSRLSAFMTAPALRESPKVYRKQAF